MIDFLTTIYPFNNHNKNITSIDYDFNYREKKIFRCNYTK